MKLTTLALLLSVGLCAQAPTGWTPELSMRVKTIGEVVPSPDGRWAAYTETRAVIEAERSEMVTELWLASAEGGQRRPLAAAGRSASSPAFSPDGRFVYFLSGGAIWRVPTGGGEGERLIGWRGQFGAYKVSPDGKWVAFTGAEPSVEEERARRERRDFRVVGENPRNHALWLIPAEAAAGGARPVRKLLAADYHIGEFDWSPDSRAIAFDHRPTPDAELARQADLSEVVVETGKARVIAATLATERQPRYSPDGRYLAFLRSGDPPRAPGEDRIVLWPRSGGAPRALPATHDELPTLLGWAANSSRLYYLEAKGFGQALYAMPVDGPPAPLYQPESGTLAGARLSAAGGHVGFVRESSQEPPEAFLLRVDGGQPSRVSHTNVELPRPPLGDTQRIRWKAADGLEIEGLLTYPAGYQRGKRHPLVLVIHGGPHSAFSDTFLGRAGQYPYASFAARGYAVLRCNIRGSLGYGRAFRFANFNDWGGKDYEDLMAGVDHVISLGVADPERMAVMGWSYGGYMTSWVITHTRRFRAAAVGAGVSNVWSQTGTSDIRSNKIEAFGAPWDDVRPHLERSPLYHVRNAATPTLILHGELDERVPISQGYELYHALERRGVPVKMVVYPRTGHGPREPKFVLDIMQRHLDWVEKYLRVSDVHATSSAR